MEELLFEDLKTELEITDAKNLNEVLLRSKVKNAIREVKSARKYPTTYTDDMIDTDLMALYSNVRNIALYDYNHVGAEFENYHRENETDRRWIEREKLFSGIYPISRL